MTREEISSFLDIENSDVEVLWTIGLLKRTIGCTYRPSGAILHSSPFDALEYGLASGDLPKRVTPEQAALWVFCLDEAVECGDVRGTGLPKETNTLLSIATEEGLAELRPDSAEIAALIAAKYREICTLMTATDDVAQKTRGPLLAELQGWTRDAMV